MRRLLAILILAQLAGCNSGDSPAEAAKSADAKKSASARRNELPVAGVTLFSGGSAYVEHKGTVRDNATVEVRAKSAQVAGVLKTLTVNDGPTSRPAATIRPVEPAAKPASSGRLDLESNPGLVDILQQFRGSSVRVQLSNALVFGTIVSLEKREKTELWQLNLLTREGIQSVAMDSVQRIELADERAQAELTRALESMWKPASEDDRRTIAVDLSGKGERAVTIGYATETKPWKTGYRLLLSEKPVLQAWVTVTNDMDFDWKNVQLTLLNGRPLLLSGDASPDSATVSKAAKTAGVPTGESLRRPRPVTARPIDATPGTVGQQNVAALPEPTGPLIDVRQVFRHTVADVSIPKKGTLMVPVLGESIVVERVAVFNESLLKRNPLQGARIQNTTRSYLLQGSVAVLDDGQYAGDAVLENLPPGRHGVVTWGIEVPVVVDASDESPVSELLGGKIDEGVLEVQRKHVYTKRYVAENESRKDQTLIVEHPIRRGWTLAEPARPLETTENLYRFRIEAPSGKRVSLVVKEETVEAETLDLATADAEAIQTLARNASLVADVRSALEKAQAIRQRVAEQDRQAVLKQHDYDRLAGDQARVRENLKSLSDTDALRAKLTEKLEQQEKLLVDLKVAIEEAQKACEKTAQSCEKEIRKVSAGR